MQPPAHYPGRIRTDETNPFANHTIRVRVPAIVRAVLAQNPDYEPRLAAALAALARELETDAPLPALAGEWPGAAEFRAAQSERDGESWLRTDWFFAETYAYRQVIERARYWDTLRDPFLPTKLEEYASSSHAEAFDRALDASGAGDERLAGLLGAALFGNRMDLSFAASRERGLVAAEDDLLVDDREHAVRRFFDGRGALHLILDNAGTELTLDLVLADHVLEVLRVPVVLHVKTHPTFVSDATRADVERFLGLSANASEARHSAACRACVTRLAAAVRDGRLTLLPHPFWNGSESLWELPAALGSRLAEARLVVLKGDANYRRAVGDAVWPYETEFRAVTAYFPAPLLALRTLKSDPIVGLPPGRAAELEQRDATWRVNGKRGVASLGGRVA